MPQNTDPTTIAEAIQYHTASRDRAVKMMTEHKGLDYMAESVTTALTEHCSALEVLGLIQTGLVDHEDPVPTLDGMAWDAVRRVLDDARYAGQYPLDHGTCEAIRYASQRDSVDDGLASDFSRIVRDRMRAHRVDHSWHAAAAQAWHCYWLQPESLGRREIRTV